MFSFPWFHLWLCPKSWPISNSRNPWQIIYLSADRSIQIRFQGALHLCIPNYILESLGKVKRNFFPHCLASAQTHWMGISAGEAQASVFCQPYHVNPPYSKHWEAKNSMPLWRAIRSCDCKSEVPTLFIFLRMLPSCFDHPFYLPFSYMKILLFIHSTKTPWALM